MKEVDVAIDWFKKKKGVRLGTNDFRAYTQARVAQRDCVGIMLHHEHMDAMDLSKLDSLLEQLKNNPLVTFCSFRDLVGENDND